MEQVTKETQEVTTVKGLAPQQVIKTKTTIAQPPIVIEHPQKIFEKKKAIFRTYQIIWYIVGSIEILLGFRMALKALGANSISLFTSTIYTLSYPLVFPFMGIFPPSGSVIATFEWSTLTAAFVYLVIALGILELIRLLKPVTPHEVEQTV